MIPCSWTSGRVRTRRVWFTWFSFTAWFTAATDRHTEQRDIVNKHLSAGKVQNLAPEHTNLKMTMYFLLLWIKIKSNSVKSDLHLRAFWLSWLASLTPLWISANHSWAPGSLLTWMDTRMEIKVQHFITACGSSLGCWAESQLPVTLYL